MSLHAAASEKREGGRQSPYTVIPRLLNSGLGARFKTDAITQNLKTFRDMEREEFLYAKNGEVRSLISLKTWDEGRLLSIP